MDVLIYLDDLNEPTGPLCVLPGSHNLLDSEPAPHLFEDLPGQETLHLPAGSAVLMHPNVWHRARPTTAEGRKPGVCADLAPAGAVWSSRRMG